MNVKERFLRYVAMDTRSDPESGAHPSSAKQLTLGKVLRDELAALGLEKVRMTDEGYVYAELPASPGCEELPSIGLIAHMDTSPDVSGENVRAHTITWTGEDTALDADGKYILSRRDFSHLDRYVGGELIVTDGSTLLGADDKAGIAEIMTALEVLIADPSISHGRVSVCFTPDEEIGEGADFFDVEGFGAAFAYTVDGGALGELEYENFNAASAVVTVSGVNIHPGEAKNKMRNAALLAAEFASLMPPAETPAHTEGYEGFFHLTRIAGDEESARLEYLIRDHDRTLFEKRKDTMRELARFLNSRYGEGVFTLAVEDSYYNMREMIEPHMHIVERAKNAMRSAGVEPVVCPIRGGTDGARLSYMGLPCPNLSTGGHNFHGRFEYIPVRSLESMVRVLTELVRSDAI